ncbi:MAG: response regulator, partial [Cyanobacteria bacterium J06632_19]
MNHPAIDLDSIRNQLMASQKRKKQKILVVDDEPDNLDLLYRTFRRDFQVLKADSGTNALQVLAEEGEVAVIISDQRMPEMKGTEFLSKTLPQFPDTVRIILTGFTDIEDLVDAINAGQVYRYITKPWDPEELKVVVQRAAETYDLLKQRTEELRRANSQMALLTSSIQVTKTVSSKEESLEPIATIYGETFAADGCILQLVENGSLTSSCATFSQDGILDNWLDKDPLVQES